MIPVNVGLSEQGRALPWYTFETGYYKPVKDGIEGGSSTIFIILTPQQHSGARILIHERDPVSIFVNGQLAGAGKNEFLLSTDSLLKAYPASRWTIAVHGRRDLSALQTQLLGEPVIQASVSPGEGLVPRGRKFFRDFVVVATLLVLILLAAARTVSPKLLSDYFSLPQLFIGRETDDAMHYGRVTRSSNLIFYALCALMMGLFMQMILIFSPAPLGGFWNRLPGSFFEALWQWLLLTLVVVIAFMAKWILVFLTSRLFGFRDIVRHYLFNWIRILLIVLAPFLALMIAWYLLAGGSGGLYHFLFGTMLWVLSIWIVIILYKVRARVGFSMFHIICYLCITELIPLLILSKILYA